MSISGSIDRTSLSLSALPFGDGSGLSLLIGGLTLGQRQWRRGIETSPYVAGHVETSAVLDQSADDEFHFRIRKATEDDVIAMYAELVAAVEQPTWDLTIVIGGTTLDMMTCDRADTQLIFDVPHARSQTATAYVFTSHAPNDYL